MQPSHSACCAAACLLPTLPASLPLHPAGLTLQLLLFPEMKRQSRGSAAPRKPNLPKVSITDNVFELRRAFKEAEHMGQQQAAKDAKRQSQDDK